MSVPSESVLPPPAPPPAVPSVEERQWALLAHLAALLGFVFPFGNVVGPLLVWLIKRESLPLVDDQGKEALNFNITVAIATAICLPLMFVLIGIPLLAAVGVYWLVFVIIAAVQTNNGTAYRYPFILRLIK